MYLQTPKRPNLPSTPSYKLPPFSSLLSKELPPPIIKPRLPSIDTLPTPITNYKFNSITPPEESDVSNDSFNDTFQELKPKIKKRKSSNDSEKSFAFISHSPATYPSQEPSIDNAPLARRKRRRTSPNELSILQQEFEKGSTPNKLRRIEISNKVNMSEKAVQIWFQNKRQSLRKQSNHEKEITELPPTPDTSNYFPIVESTPTKPAFNSSSTPFTKLDIDPIDTSSLNNNLVLNNTKKKQPNSLNSINSQTMTFKLAPAKVATPNLLNKLKLEERSPLKEINLNKPKKDNECIENLLSLKTGNWK